MESPTSTDLTGLARELNVPVESVEAVVRLLGTGNTVPFLTKYRRDDIGGLDLSQVTQIKNRVDRRQILEERKKVILRAISARGELSEDLEKQIKQSHSPKVLEDIYLPFKTRKQATQDRSGQHGLQNLADAILSLDESKSVDELAQPFVNAEQGLDTVNDVIDGARALIEERFNYNIELRKSLRRVLRRTGILVTKRAVDENHPQELETAPPNHELETASQNHELETAPRNQELETASPNNESSEVAKASSKQSAVDAQEDAVDEPDAIETETEHKTESASQPNPNNTPDPPATATNSDPPDNPSATVTSGADASDPDTSDPDTSAADTSGADTSGADTSGADMSGADTSDKLETDTPCVSPPLTEPTSAAGADAPSQQATSSSPLAGPKKESKRTSRVSVSGMTLSKEARRQMRREARHRKRKKLESTFAEYFDYHESVAKIREHRILAIDRGERFRVIDVHVTVDNQAVNKEAESILVPAEHPRADFLRQCVHSALSRLVLPSLERELRRELSERAEAHAIRAFSGNLRKLLLRRPVRERILAISPDYRHACGVVALDETGHVLEHKQLHLLGNDERKKIGKTNTLDLITLHQTKVVAIGGGKGCREIEQMVGEWIQKELADQDVRYAVVNESGVNRYATSVLAVEELPQLTPAAREAAALGRRLLDPLSEFVKVEPGAINVGTYPDEMKAKPIQDSLSTVVFECVNTVGVNVNSASTALLRHVSGLNQLTAQRIYEHRCIHGPFRTRAQIRNVTGMTEDAFIQAAGFLRIPDGDEPLDATAIHPEHYKVAEQLLQQVGASLEDLRRFLKAQQQTQSDRRSVLSKAIPDQETSSEAENTAPSADTPSPESATSDDMPADATPPTAAAGHGTIESAGATPADDEVTSDAETGHQANNAVSSAESTVVEPPAKAATKSTNVDPVLSEPAVDAPATSWRFAEKLSQLNVDELANDLDIGKFLLATILAELANPGRDPRSENLGPTLRKGIISFNSLTPGLALTGTVVNVVDFGVFVDIGLKESGLVHISRMADHFVRDPHELFSVGQSLPVWVVEVDQAKRRVALTAVEPGTEKPAESRPRGNRQRSAKPARSKPSRRPKGRKDAPRSGRAKSRRAPKPVTPITQGMIDGNEPMRTFSDLLQFADKKRKGKNDGKKGPSEDNSK